MKPNLYAYEGIEQGPFIVPKGTDPHAVKLVLSDEDRRRFSNHRFEEQDMGWASHQPGDFIQVTDLTTGEKWDVATHPCGLGCRCAAIAIRSEEDVSDPGR